MKAITFKSPITMIVMAIIVLSGCQTVKNSVSTQPHPHPLDPLTVEEYVKVTTILREAGRIDDASRFSTLDLHDPEKANIKSWHPGDDLARTAFAIVKQGAQTFEAVVNISNSSVSSWLEIEGVQPSLLLEEIMGIS
ncbi:MAG: primary-amine oxidase, partial [Gammaproteobacteria bacterium]